MCHRHCVTRNEHDPRPRPTRTEAGAWLRRERELRGWRTAKSFAAALGVDPSQISNYERGVNAIDDERAAQIAAVLRMDEIEVRRSVGLWVPGDGVPTPQDLSSVPDTDLIAWAAEIARRWPGNESIQASARLLATLAKQAERSEKSG